MISTFGSVESKVKDIDVVQQRVKSVFNDGFIYIEMSVIRLYVTRYQINVLRLLNHNMST